jgi:hypothetical protein
MKNSFTTQFKNTIKILGWSLFKVPLLFIMRPWVNHLSGTKSVISLPCSFVNRNHFSSLYLGALVGGADLAAGLLSMEIMREQKVNLSIIFKDIKCDFLQRSHSRTFFVCEDSDILRKSMLRAVSEKSRTFALVNVSANTFLKKKEVCVANFTLTISFK